MKRSLQSLIHFDSIPVRRLAAASVVSLALSLPGCSASTGPNPGGGPVGGKADEFGDTEDYGDTEGGGTTTTGDDALLSDVVQLSFDSWPSLGQSVDVYFPADAGHLPVVVLLQGANVDKGQYSTYASTVAHSGYVVLVPNARSIVPPGLFPRQSVITKSLEGFEAIAAGQADGFEALEGVADPDNAAVLGHSFGGAAGLNAIAGNCSPPFCFFGSSFEVPDSVKAAIFFGTNNAGPNDDGGALRALDTTVPVALIQGLEDTIGEADKADRTFDAIADNDAQLADAALVTLEGVNHYGITNVNNPEGAQPDLADDLIEQERATEAIAHLTIEFLHAWVVFEELTPTDAERISNLDTVTELSFDRAR